MNTNILLADEVVNILNAATLSQPFTAERQYVPKFDHRELNDLTVVVVPASQEIGTFGRSHLDNTYQVQIGVMKRLEFHGKDIPDIDAVMNPMMDLVTEIMLLVKPGTQIPSLNPMTCFDIGNNPLYDQIHFSKDRQFTSVIAATFRSVKPGV